MPTSPDISQDAINEAEDHIAYDSQVELVKWLDSSQWGFKITLNLKDRAELDYFDGVMVMRKNRGGQRYSAIFDGEQNQEMQFCGRGWSESGGAHIALHVPHLDDQVFWRGSKTRDQVEKDHYGVSMHIMLMELDDNEEIINQAKRARVRGVVDPMPKGGPRSKAIAILMNDAEWCDWLKNRSIYKSWHRPPKQTDGMIGNYDLDTLIGRDQLVKKVLCVTSKIELDHGAEEAWLRWEQNFHRPFIQWMQRHK